MIRIAHCIHGLGLGGAQKVIASIAERGLATRIKHYVYSTEDGDLRADVERAGASVRILPRHVPKFDPIWVRTLARAMARDEVELVHTHLFGDSLHGYLAARCSGNLPTVMTIHNELSSFTPIQRAGYRFLLSRCDRTVACSENVRQSIEASGHPVKRLHCIPNGIEEPPAVDAALVRRRLLEELGLASAADRIVFAAVGRLTEQKGLSVLLAAFASLPPDLAGRSVLLLVGEGELRADLEREARTRGVADRVVFTGFRSDVAALLRAIDVLVFSSFWEGLPIALLEAMASDVCIVGTRIPGIEQAVEDERQALLVPPGDAEALGAALVRAARNDDLRRRLGDEALARFRARFTAGPMVRDYEAIYADLLGRPDDAVHDGGR